MEGDRMFPGQRFCPMEDELLMFYLKPKVNGMQVPGEGDVICELDLYGDQDPWKIWKDFEAKRANDLRRSKDLYFFTQKKKKTTRSSRASRTVGNGGTWKGQNAAKPVFLLDENQERTTTVLGFKTTYTYKNKSSVHDGCWIMYEFELHNSLVKKQVNKNDYVLCLLRKKDLVQGEKRKGQQTEEILGDSIEEDDGDKIDHGFVSEGSQEKRQRVLPSLEVDQEQFLQPPFEDQFLQLPPSFEAEQEAVPMPFEDQPIFFQDDENMELQESDFAILEKWWKDEFEASPATLEDGQVSVLVDENSRLQQVETEQLGEANLEQMIDPPSIPADEIMSGEQFHPDETLVEQMGAEANVYVENLGDSMAEYWLTSIAKELMNGEQLQAMEVEELITTPHAGGYSAFDCFEY